LWYNAAVPSDRLLIVSNRLPVTAGVTDGQVHLTSASGGLATGLKPWHESSNGLWIGWPGPTSSWSEDQRAALAREFASRRIVPVHLSEDHVRRYYNGFANRVLWPLFHYLIDRVPVDAAGWDAYKEVNARFADVVAREYREGDMVWVHDYQLMLVPAMLRERIPSAKIGFFLHIPFPSSEVFRILPWRREILRGLLGADLVGFHTFAYLRQFVGSLLHVDGVESDVDRVRIDNREVRLGVFPMGIDAQTFATAAQTDEVLADIAEIRRDAGARQILLGIDRLDYTKGIPRRLLAIERLLQRDPELRDRIRYVQVAVPSREDVDSYQKFRRLVEETVGRINGACGTLCSTPIHYLHRSVSMSELVALYSAADVMLVTPLRDGMNLVAKEFVACRTNDDGVLVLSEFAGAAAELCGAVVVNPYDVDAVADAIQRALVMSAEERRARMRKLRRRVHEHDVHSWATNFVTELRGSGRQLMRAPERPLPDVATAIAAAQQAGTVRLLLDYDGTLVPMARAPELAAPDAELVDLLHRLASTPGICLELVSGRPRDTLAAWFGHLPIALWAEHGFWHRRRDSSTWEPSRSIAPDWMQRVLPILQQFTETTPGARLEIKSAAIAWHFRGCEREFGARQAHELRMLLGDALSNQPLEVLEGKKVVEVRWRGVSKAIVTEAAREGVATTVAFGDDRTDEDLFRALPEGSVTVAVGQQLAGASYCVESYRQVRDILRLVSADPVVTEAEGTLVAEHER
jgi:trehalose 6-phosphate synthase/phosphatase